MDSETNDPLMEELLAPPEATPRSGLHGFLLVQTQAKIRTLRWFRRLRMIGGLVLSFLAGGIAFAILQSGPQREVRYLVIAVPASEGRQEKSEDPEIIPPRPVPQPQSPLELERQAERIFERTESARRFREAGDLYLLAEGNPDAALRCYRNFLDEADSKDLNVSPGDTWLLTTLKNARLKGSTNADPN